MKIKMTIKCTLIAAALILLPAAAEAQDERDQTQYLLPRFSYGVVTKKSGMPVKSLLNYNCLTEEMIFVQDDRRLALTNLESIDTVYIDEHIFIPFGEVFLEVLVDGEADLFVQHKYTAKIEGEEVGYGGTSELSNVKSLSSMRENGQTFYMDMPQNISIIPDAVYWLRKSGDICVIYNKRTVIKALPGLEGKLKSWFKQNKTNFDSSEDLVKLVNAINNF